MKKIALIVLGIIVFVMGILGLIPGLAIGTEPVWHAIVKVVIGLAATYIGFAKE